MFVYKGLKEKREKEKTIIELIINYKGKNYRNYAIVHDQGKTEIKINENLEKQLEILEKRFLDNILKNLTFLKYF